MNESDSKEVILGYSVRRESWLVGGRPIELAWPRDMDALLDSRQTHERFARNQYMPYWAQPWPAGILLAEYVLNHEPGAGRSAVELGCGVGLVSVAATLMGWRVTATDHDEDALAFARLNAEANGVSLEATEWVDFVEQSSSRRYDRVLAADLLYERRLCDPVARWIASALAPQGCALVSDPNRSAAADFPGALARHGLVAEQESVWTTTPAGLLCRGRIYCVRRASGE